MYSDFEATTPTDNCFNPEQKKNVCYVLCLKCCFYPHLNLRKIIVERSYGHSLEQLTTIDYLTNDQISFIDVTLVKQSKRYCTESKSKKM